MCYILLLSLKCAFVCYLGHSEATDVVRPCQTSIQLAFACSKSAIETLEKDVKYIQSYWTYLTPFSSVSIANFEQVNVSLDGGDSSRK